MRLRTRTAIIVAAMSAALLAGGVSPAAALSEQTAAARAVAGRMLASPGSEALVKRLPVRVVVRVPARTSRLRVRLGRRDVSARFGRSRGSLRVARLTRGDGLRYGHNHLVVLAERRGGRPVIDARSFVLARRQHGLMRLRVRPGPVTSVDVRVAGGLSLAPEHFGQPGAVERRLSVIRRERTVRLWLNGRRVTRALDRSRPTRWTAKLSATQGLRYGANRLRIQVAEPDRGRYQLVRRSFVVRRDRHLASAGWDTATRVRGRVRLDGRRSRTTRGGRPDHNWSILTRPRGSRAKLRRAGSARPVLTPDRPGRYVVGLTVTDGSGRATASQAPPSSADTVVVTSSPSSLLVPFKGLTVQNGRPGIQVGGAFYPNPSPNGSAMQWLTLDRATLTPCDDPSRPCGSNNIGNSWLDGTGSGGHGVGELTSALGNQDSDQLVILSFPYAGGPGPPVQQDQIDAFNGAMKTLGVEPIDKGILQDHNKLAIVGVPSGGPGSGWYTHGGGPVDALRGWLMLDEKKSFRLQPERPVFDTSSSSTPTTNTMTVRDQRIDAALPPGTTGGFQVVKIDPIDFTVVDHAVFGTNQPSASPAPVQAMAKYVNDAGGTHVAVQSIGTVGTQGGDHLAAWVFDLAKALSAYGANPHTFNTVNGSYAFLGGSWLEKSEVADSSSAVAIDPVKNKNESGTLRGRVSMRRDGYWMPVAADPAKSLELELYDMVFRSPTPWPYTTGAFPQHDGCPDPGTDAGAYAKALSYIAVGINLPTYQSNLRAAYVERDQFGWTDAKVDLSNLPYKAGQGFGQAEFCNLKAQLQLEFDWLDAVKTPFDSFDKALGRSGPVQQARLYLIGERIRTAVAPDNSAEIGWSVGGFVGNLVSAGLVLASGPAAGPVLAAWEALVVIYELARELTSEAGGAPSGDEVGSTVEHLSLDVTNQLADTANGLDRLRDVIISDYGRLQALGTAALGRGWNVDVPDMTGQLTTSASAFFSSELVPVLYGVHAMYDGNGQHWRTPADGCAEQLYGRTWQGVPASAWMWWNADFERDGYHGWPFPTLFALGRHDLSIRYYAYPPAEVVDPMFTPPTRNVYGQDGYGLQLPRFVWEQYEKGFPPTNISVCAFGP